MSRYPEADEAQHRHYNDSFAPYPSTTPNPYDQYEAQPNPYDRQHQTPAPYGAGTPHHDPFNPVPHNPYSSPPPPPPPPPTIYPPSWLHLLSPEHPDAAPSVSSTYAASIFSSTS
ncbi:hypothetical protein NLJ89_g1513 [Agrocybe chaxingu]|uniref:Uncharacterized protein n=1 Tax=Agrocybe chaxingu TaxID=84603 RepID=A0A9W8MZX1_9AGAR|nr:hypothetical protein NLJ89_g1513 [Agrocybe chaxingu]